MWRQIYNGWSQDALSGDDWTGAHSQFSYLDAFKTGLIFQMFVLQVTFQESTYNKN